MNNNIIDISFEYSTENPILCSSRNLSIAIPGYIAMNIDRDFANSFPNDIIELFVSFSHIHCEQVRIKHNRRNKYKQHRFEISIPITNPRYGYYTSQQYYDDISNTTIEEKKSNTKMLSTNPIQIPSDEQVCKNWLKWNCRLGWRCPDRHRGPRDETLRPNTKQNLKNLSKPKRPKRKGHLYFDVCVSFYEDTSLSSVITLKRHLFKQKFAAYIDKRCVEFDKRLGYGGAILIDELKQEKVIPGLTYKCYFDIIPLHQIPSIEDEIEFVWNIDRDLLRKNNYQLTSPILEIYNCKSKQNMNYYYLAMNKHSIDLHCTKIHKMNRVAFKYRIEIEFDEMTMKWGGLAITKGYRDYSERCLNVYPSHGWLSMQYYRGWFKRFLPTIRCIKLRFRHEQ